jgi:hypothetical protein
VVVIPAKVASVELVLVIWSGSVAEEPSWTVPKSSDRGETVRAEGVAYPRRLMKSIAVLEPELISSALMRALEGFEVGCGVKLTTRRQLAEGRMMSQLLWVVKSGLVVRLVIWRGTVPVLARVTVWGCGIAHLCCWKGEGAL